MNSCKEIEPIRKYKIEALLQSLNYLDHKKAMKELPLMIGKCKNTFIKYIKIEIDSEETIPYDVGIIIEKYFKIPPGTLSNVIYPDQQNEHQIAIFAR